MERVNISFQKFRKKKYNILYMAIVSWKNQTFTQIIASIQLNRNDTIISPYNLRRAPPLKIYRKEISRNNQSSQSSRLGIRINAFETPNGYSISKTSDSNDLVTVLDVKETGLKDNCSNSNICFTPQANALKRIRTSGIINNNYSVNTSQYLKSKNLSYTQNTFHYENDNVTYKPNNTNFATQGAVTSSSFLLRKKFDTIRSNADKYLKPYGPAVSNAMSYGISDSIYTYKNKIAFPTKLTPSFKKNSETMLCTRHITR